MDTPQDETPAELPGPTEPEPDGVPLPDPLAIPAEIIADLEEAAKGNHDASAVKKLQDALGTNAQSVRARLRGQAIIALATAGHTRAQIAKLIGIKENAVKVAIWRARKAGQLNDLRDILEHDCTANAVDTISHHLRKKNHVVAIEHLKGIGWYKNHSHAKFDGAPPGGMPALTVNVLVQQSTGTPAVTPETFDVSEMVVGVPREDAGS